MVTSRPKIKTTHNNKNSSDDESHKHSFLRDEGLIAQRSPTGHHTGQMGCRFQAAFSMRGLFLTCFLQLLGNCHRGRGQLPRAGLGVPERPRGAQLPLSLHPDFLIWKIGTLLLPLLAVCFSGTERTERLAYVRGFELSDYIKVKVLRTEILNYREKVLDL